ncbi:MAG: hypothetical protein ACWA41_06705 [Putridiphycobacter sp.]
MKFNVILLWLFFAGSPYFGFASKDTLKEKRVISVLSIDNAENAALFKPWNKYFFSLNLRDKNYNFKKYILQTNLNWNLYTLMTYYIIAGRLTLYVETDFENPLNKDTLGFLSYPILAEKYGTTKKGNLTEDSTLRMAILNQELIGEWDKMPPIKILSKVNPKQDSLDENGDKVYYHKGYYLHTDKMVVGYKLSEVHNYSKKNELESIEIKAIAPVFKTIHDITYEISYPTPFWIDFKSFSKILKHAVIPGEEKLTYLKYFKSRQFVVK